MKPWLLPLFLAAFGPLCTAASVSITTTTVPNGTAETAYSAVIQASGGCTPYKWAVVSGALPAGVTATPSSKTTALDLTGTPSQAATYSFTISVTGCGKHVSETSYQVVIQAAAKHVVDLSWTASTSKDVAGYNVYRGPNGTNWSKINVALVASAIFDDATVADGSTYYYAVTAVDIYGKESSKTAAVKAVIP